MITLAKKQPGRLNYGSGGLGSASHLAAEVFSSMAGIRIAHIPYKGVGLAFVDLVGGQLDLSSPAIPSGVPYHRSGRLRALGVTSLRRHASIPEDPGTPEEFARLIRDELVRNAKITRAAGMLPE